MNIEQKCVLTKLMPFMSALIFLVIICPTKPAASEECLLFQYAKEAPGHIDIILNFKAALDEADICVEVIPIPLKRHAKNLRSEKMDGTILRAKAFGKSIGTAAIMIEEPLVTAHGLIITYDKILTSAKDLIGRSVLVQLGTHWPSTILKAGTEIIETQGFENQIQMLKQQRVDAIIMDSISAEKYRHELAGTHQIEVADLSGHAWIRNGLRHLAPQINNAIIAFKRNGRSFADKTVLIQ